MKMATGCELTFHLHPHPQASGRFVAHLMKTVDLKAECLADDEQ